MKNRTLSSLGLGLGSVLLGLIAGAAGANLYVAGDAAPEGSVAKFRRSDSGGCKVVNCRIRLVGEPEQPGDEESLADRISFCQPSHSALANHVHRFNSL